MNRKSIAVFVLIVILILGLFSCEVSARYATSSGDNTGIYPGERIYLGESNLDFSAFADPAKGQLLYLKPDSTSLAQIDLNSNFIGSVGTDLPAGSYYACYIDANGSRVFDYGKYCTVASLSFGQMYFYPYNVGTVPPLDNRIVRSSTLSESMELMFYMPNLNVESSQLNGRWYEYQLTLDGTTITNVRDPQGTAIDLFTGEPKNPDQSIAFLLGDQLSQRPVGSYSGQMTFRVNLNGASGSALTTYAFTVGQHTVSLSPSQVSRGQGSSVNLDFTGIPLTTYTITITPPASGGTSIRFTSVGSNGTISSDGLTATVTLGTSGSERLAVDIPSDAVVGSYYVRVLDHSSVYSNIVVTKSGLKLVFDEPSSDVLNGRFAVGDDIQLVARVNGASQKVPLYYYLTGPNLPSNGVSLLDPSREVVDGDPSSFFTATYDPMFGDTIIYWSTRNLDAGTYTVHINLEPYGHLSSDYPGGPGNINGEVPPSHDYPLSEQSIQAKSSDKNGGYFAKGSIFYSWWIARGSPGVGEQHPNAEVRWYIFGTNFRYADRNDMVPLYSGDIDDRSQLGIIAPWAEYGFTYNRNFTYDLTPGTYYLLYQHPGANNQFDVYADPLVSGTLTKVSTTFGSSADVSNLQSRAAAEAVKRLFEDPFCDDLYIMTNFVIEDPWITFDTVENIAVGDAFEISGKTNLATGDETADETKVEDALSLTINRLDLNLGTDASTAMKIPVSSVNPSATTPFRGYRTFSFDGIDTSTWYPGTYEATITCKDVNFKQSYTFTILTQEEKQSNLAASPSYDPALTQNSYSSAQATAVVTPTITYQSGTPAATQSPGFAAVFILLTLGILTLFWRK